MKLFQTVCMLFQTKRDINLSACCLQKVSCWWAHASRGTNSLILLTKLIRLFGVRACWVKAQRDSDPDISRWACNCCQPRSRAATGH
jgi:hypothetical protein